MKVTVKCDYCGKEFEKYQSKIGENNFCNRECKLKYFSKKITVKCNYCGKEIEKSPSKINKTNYCNDQCYKKSLPLKKTKVKCDYCGKEIEKYKKEIAKNVFNVFCNRQCTGMWKNLKVKVKCDLCGKEVRKPPSAVKKTNFCSGNCQHLFRLKSYKIKKLSGISYSEVREELASINSSNLLTIKSEVQNAKFK